MNKRQLLLLSYIATCIIILSRCATRQPPIVDLRGEQFAAAASCANCHADVYAAYSSTAHAHTSAIASPQTVKGSFTAPHNTFRFGEGSDVVMTREDSTLYQAAYHKGALKQKQPFDIVVGSGRKAQTYLYWQAGQYFQLPISYFVPVGSWANSPGFPATHARFDRVIPSTCFGCHSSGVAVKEERSGLQNVEKFGKREMVAGIDCQRCHGPAAEHVNFHTENPGERTARFITRIDTLSRGRQLDACALCHSGLRPFRKSAFAFKPGDALADYLLPTVPFPRRPDELDVHGNQYQLLAASRCFSSETIKMTCSTCHSPHATERNDLQVFAKRCMNCHGGDFKHQTPMSEEVMYRNCINCHMPALPSSAITLLTNGQGSPVADSVRTHLIAVYDKLKVPVK